MAGNKKQYIKPEITTIKIDMSISLVMQSTPPTNPGPRGGGKKGADSPFETPFGDKPFS
jgi:hypothetical protein